MKHIIANTLLVAALICVGACGQSSAPEDQSKRFAVIKYQHETCTFCPGGDTEIADWTTDVPFVSGAELLDSDSYIRGFVHTSRQFDDVELVSINSPDGVFGGSSRSWNSKASFDHFMGIILDDLKAKMPVDGVYLALHGAMAVRDVPRPEAEIAKRIRELVGPDVPIAASFDLHGNEDGEFLEWADAAFTTKRYPHYDSALQGSRAATFLYRTVNGLYDVTTASRKPPIITGTVLQWTGQSPSMDIMERARRWEARVEDVYVSVFYGFPWSDVPDVGTTVHVMTNNHQELAEHIADDMEEYILRVRETFANGDFPMPGDAIQQTVAALESGDYPVALGDYSDRPGDATWILKEIIENNVGDVLYAALRDERAIASLLESGAKPGDVFDMEVGGFTGKQAGQPVRIQGTVRYVGPEWNYDNIAVIEFGNNNLLMITPTYEQVIHVNELRVLDIDPDNYKVFVVKSRVHFRRGFDETGYAKTIIVVDSPGSWFGTTRLDGLDYEHAPINELYPFDN